MKPTLPMFTLVLVLTLVWCACEEKYEPAAPQNSAPETPSHPQPADDATGQDTSLTLSWDACADPENDPVLYDVYFGTAPSPPLAAADRESVRYAPGPLGRGTTYYWRVAAMDDRGNVAGGPVWRFTTGDAGFAPPVPMLSSPPDSATGVLLPPTLAWNPSTGATSYGLQVAGEPSFASPIVSESGLTVTSRQVQGLANSTTYYWRVRASNSHGASAWSEVRRFTTREAASIPPPPTLLAPANGAEYIAPGPTLAWNASPGAVQYSLQVSKVSTFLSFVFNEFGIAGTSRQVNEVVDSTTYYWRVSATNSHGTSGWSETWRFTVGPAGSVPLAPLLLFPPEGGMHIVVPPRMVWQASAGAAEYALQVATDGSFATLVYNQGGITVASREVTGLGDSVTYYWRVNASNHYGTSPWSAVRHFTTAGSGTGEPCPGSESVAWQGKNYTTVLIGSQCWFRENLDAGTMISGALNQANNGVVEKYCYNDDPAYCVTHGGLYQWQEAVQYNVAPGAQGLCPPGWNVPTLTQYETLAACVGGNANTLKAVGQGTGGGAGTNTTGFTALLGGVRYFGGFFSDFGNLGGFWMSKVPNTPHAHYLWLNAFDANMGMYDGDASVGMSLRCVKE
ncbi:MAG: FISUMP domain-containing protein [Bacteroidota bacterium]